jgi:CRISPR-associated protein Cmr6
MREALNQAFEHARASGTGCPYQAMHPGLAYAAWAPTATGDGAQDGSVPDQKRKQWLDQIALWRPDDDYRSWLEDHWQASFKRSKIPSIHFDLELRSRLLVGSGNPSATDVGLTVHRAWGVPLIPGSALKGLTAAYAARIYGGEGEESASAEDSVTAALRAKWRSGQLAHEPPGEFYALLFGAPAHHPGHERSAPLGALEGTAPQAPAAEAVALRGAVCFHDALYVPSDGPEGPYVPDVTTIHQKPYYEGGDWPNDWSDPVPISYLTVRPGSRFLIYLSASGQGLRLDADGVEAALYTAKRLLCEALEDWGVAAKTSSGYGRLVKPEKTSKAPALRQQDAERSRTRPGQAASGPSASRGPAQASASQKVRARLLAQRTKRGGWRAEVLSTGEQGEIVDQSELPADLQEGQELDLYIHARKAGGGVSFRYKPAAQSKAKGSRRQDDAASAKRDDKRRGRR